MKKTKTLVKKTKTKKTSKLSVVKAVQESSLLFQATRDELKSYENNMEFFEELDRMVNSFHSSVDELGRVHSVPVKAHSFFTLVK